MNSVPNFLENVSKTALQELASAMSEGVILVGVDQSVNWANRAALEMHGVDSIAALGGTIDEYHAHFQMRFSRIPASEGLPIAGAPFREALAEITLAPGAAPCRRRVRNLVLTDDAGAAAGIALVISATDDRIAPQPRYRCSIEALPRPAAIVRSADRQIMAVNDAFAAMTGLDERAVLGRDAAEFEFLDACLSACQGNVASSGGATPPLRGRTRVPRPDGGVCAMEFDRQPIALGEHDSALLTFFDLDATWLARAAHEGALGTQAVAAGLISAAAPVPIYALDENARVVAASDSWLSWLGYRESDVLGRSIGEFVGEESLLFLKDHFLPSLLSTGAAKDSACRFRAQSGSWVAARVEARALGSHTTEPRFVCAATDLSAVRAGEAGWQAIFALSPVPMVIRKQDGRILAANPAFFDATGFGETDAVGHSFEELVAFDNPASSRRFDSELRAGQPPQKIDVRLRTSGTQAVECQLTATGIHAFDQPCHVIALLDVAERRRDERQLFQAVEQVMQDSAWFSRMVVEKLAAVRTPPVAVGRSPELDDLTKREREVLAMISHGWSDAEIAQRLGLTRSTVRNHVAALYGKIEVHNRSSAIVWARDRALNVMFPASRFGTRGLPAAE